MKISERIWRWWKPAKWADDHPEVPDPKLEAYAEKYAGTKTLPHEAGYTSSEGGTPQH